MIHASRLLKSSTLVQIWDDSQASRDKVDALLKNIEANGHVQLNDLQDTLLDYMTGAPSRKLVVALDSNQKIVGALSFVDSKDEQEIKALGVVHGDNMARSLVRALDSRKAWVVSALEPHHAVYQALGFRHSEEFDPGEPSVMVRYPAGHTASSDLLVRAEAFARKFHSSVVNADGSIGQKRKYTGEDYIVHPIAVSKILAEHGHDEITQAAALLHDVVEDTAATLEDVRTEFGPDIAEIVRQATHVATKEDGNRAKRKEIDRAHYQTGDERGQSLKLADILHNISDIVPYVRGFAKTWVPEAEALAQSLTKGNPVLREKVLAKIAETMQELGLKTASVESTLVLWHGGNLEGPLEAFPNQKGSRSWYGPGLYLTTNWETARKYSKGSRKLYRITISKGNDANEMNISAEDAIGFVKTYIAKAKQAETIQAIQKYPELRAAWFMSMLINIGNIRPGYTGILRQFLVEHGVDYEIVDNAFGWGERMVVLYNMAKIVKKEIITPKTKIDTFDLPTDFKTGSTGDWVKDSTGSPLLVFHGTDADEFTEFKTPAYFTDDYEMALDRAKTRQNGSERVLACYIRNADEKTWMGDGLRQFVVNNPSDIKIVSQDYKPGVKTAYRTYCIPTDFKVGSVVAPEKNVIEASGRVLIKDDSSYVEGQIFSDTPEVAKLFEIWVQPDRRGSGVGFTLLMQFVEWCRSKGVKYILGLETNEEKIPYKMRLKIPNSITVRADFREEDEPSLVDEFHPDNANTSECLDQLTIDPNGQVLLTKVARMLKVSHILKKANEAWDSAPDVNRGRYREQQQAQQQQQAEKVELRDDIRQFAKDYMAKNGLSSYSITDLFQKPELKQHSYRLLSALEKALNQNNLLGKVKQMFGEKITDWFYSGKIAARISDHTQVFFHGTPSEANAQAIMEGGIQPRDIQDPTYAGRGWMAPPKGRVYVSPSIEYAAIYALGGDMFGSDWCLKKEGYGYIFEIPGSSLEGDVQPDEDSIGEAVHDALLYTQAEKRMKALQGGATPKSASEMESLQRVLDIQSKNTINNPSNESIRLNLVSIAQRTLSDNQIKRISQGLYAEWARSGKKLQKVLPENISEALLSWGSHVSHHGIVYPLKAWKFLKADAAKIQKSEILSICEEIALTAPKTKVAHIDMVEAFCVNDECPDYQKKGAGNLTQEFSYGVNHDRFMLYCKTCKKRFSETKCSEFFGAKISSDDIVDILEKASEGMSVREIAEALNLNKDTVNQAINKAKEICEDYVGDGPKQVTNEMLGDLNLPVKEKSSVKEFITEIVVPRMKEDK